MSSIVHGSKFGRWTVIDKNTLYKKQSDSYFCQCVCGNKKWVFGNNLVSGQSKGCGCIRKPEVIGARKRVDHTGEVYGDYIVVRMLPTRKKVRQEYIAVCENGHEILVDIVDLKQENKKKRKCWCSEENLLRRHRKRLNYSLDDMALLTGLSRQTVNMAESSPKGTSIQSSELCAKALGLYPEETLAYLNEHYPRGYF